MNKSKPTLVKQHALKCSNQIRLGKFKRVSADFIEQCEADFDAWIRRLNTDIHTQEDIVEADVQMLTKEARERLVEIANKKLAAIIQNRVRQHPSIGKTLQG